MNKIAEEQLQMIQDCLVPKRVGYVNDKEKEFLTDMAGRITLGMGLTTKQVDYLDAIWEKATKNG